MFLFCIDTVFSPQELAKASSHLLHLYGITLHRTTSYRSLERQAYVLLPATARLASSSPRRWPQPITQRPVL